MTEVLVVGFIIVWFVYWGWMFATRPETAFKFNEMGQQNMRRGFGGIGKALMLGFKLFRK